MENKKLTRTLRRVRHEDYSPKSSKEFWNIILACEAICLCGIGGATNRLDEMKEFWSLLLSKVMPCYGEERKGAAKAQNASSSFIRARAKSSRQQTANIPIARTFPSFSRQWHTFSLMKKYQKIKAGILYAIPNANSLNHPKLAALKQRMLFNGHLSFVIKQSNPRPF